MASDGDCIFCRIAAGEIPADVVRDSDGVIAFRDLNPQAPTHVLVVTREHYRDVVETAAADPQLLATMVRIGSEVAAQEADGQFRLVFNTGETAGQSVHHVHGHVLAGRALHWPPG
jgi:histidine triad (HIT) family protein